MGALKSLKGADRAKVKAGANLSAALAFRPAAVAIILY